MCVFGKECLSGTWYTAVVWKEALFYFMLFDITLSLSSPPTSTATITITITITIIINKIDTFYNILNQLDVIVYSSHIAENGYTCQISPYFLLSSL
jgi:hypothetical protein